MKAELLLVQLSKLSRREKTQLILAKKKKTLDNKKKCILRILTTLDLKNLRVCKTIQEV